MNLLSKSISGAFSANESSIGIVTSGHPILVVSKGTFVTSTMTLQIRWPDGSWQDVPDTIITKHTAPSCTIAQVFPPNVVVRVTCAGVTADDVEYFLQV